MDIAARTYPFERKTPFTMPEEFAWLRANSPVAEVKLASGDPAWVITKYHDVRTALSDPRFSRTINRPEASELDTGFKADSSSPVFNFGASISEPPGHTRWRRIVSKAFTPSQAESMRARMSMHTDEILDRLVEHGGEFDLMADYAYHLPIRVMREILGIPDEDTSEFTELAGKLTRREQQGSFEEFGQALQGIGRYAASLISRKRRDRGDDLLSTMIDLHDEDDSKLSNEELVATVVLLMMAGYESTAVQFGNAIYALLLNPDQWRLLRDKPELIGNGVEELMRYAQMSTGYAVAKFATEDIEISRVTIPSGATIFVSLGSGNRDEEIFGDDADRLILDRELRERQLALSHGPHFCLGASLARTELQEGIVRLVQRFPDLSYAGGNLDEVPLTSNLFTFFPSELRVRP